MAEPDPEKNLRARTDCQALRGTGRSKTRRESDKPDASRTFRTPAAYRPVRRRFRPPVPGARARSWATRATSKDLVKHPEIWTVRASGFRRARFVRHDRAFVRPTAQSVALGSARPVATALLFRE